MEQKQLTRIQVADVCRSLALLLHAGVSVADGLVLLAEEETDASVQAMLKTMSQQMDDGCTLEAAMKQTNAFPPYAVGLASVGEYTGRLEEALQALARYYEERARIERQLKNAMTYPAILLMVMLVVIVVLLSQVLPVFNDVYASLGGSLTGIAGGLLILGRWLDAIMPVLCVLLAAVLLFVALFFTNRKLHNKVVAAWQGKYGDRGVSRRLNEAHAAQVLAMGLQSGLSPEQALELAAELMQSTPTAAERCKKGSEHLADGANLAEALEKAEVLPPSSCRLLAVALRGGTTDAVMQEISERLSEEADEELFAQTARIEPSLVLVASLLVGLILLSVMLPLMHIMTAIG